MTTTVRSLKINIAEGKDLSGLDAGGVSDCYCKFKCGSISSKTDVIKKTTTPLWNQMISIGVYDEKTTILEFQCFDWERIGGDRPLTNKLQVPVSDLIASARNGQMDQWLKLSKGFIRISFEFTPPYQTEVDSISPTALGSTSSLVNQSMSSFAPSMIAPPVVYFKPIFLPTVPIEMMALTNSLTTTAKFIMPGAIYQTKPFITGELVNCSLIINVYEPRIVVRALNLQFFGSIVYKGKKQRKLVNDYRDLLMGYGNQVVSATTSNKVVLERGKHVFPFQFFIDKSCKSSISLSNGYRVSYSLQFSADIVNQPDISLLQEITVVNLEDTVYKMTIAPMNGTASKSPLTGGNISLTCKSPKNSFYPREEIELEIQVNNASKKKIKAVDIQLFRLEYDGTDVTPIQSTILSITKKFYPKVKQNSNRSMIAVVELPDNSYQLVHSISETKMIRIEYYLIVNLDIPNCVDLRLKLPVTIVQPDPKFELLPNPLNEIGSLPRYIKDWTHRNFHSWVLFKKQCPEVFDNNLEFYQYNLNGVDLMQLSTEMLYNIFKGAGPRTPELVSDLQSQILEIQSVRNFFKELQLSDLIDTFEKQYITWEILPMMTYPEILSLGLTVGDAKRIDKKIKLLTSQNKFDIVSISK